MGSQITKPVLVDMEPLDESKASKKAKSTPVLQSAYIGPKIIDFESPATKLSKKDIQETKKAYEMLVEETLDMLHRSGHDKPNGSAWNLNEIADAWNAISSFLWSKLRPGGSILLTNAFSDYAKGKAGANLDCDSSAIFVADVFSKLDLGCTICVAPWHSFLEVRSGSTKIWIETTADTRQVDVNRTFYQTAQQVGSFYHYYTEEKFSEKMALSYNNRGTAKFSLNDYKGALADFNEAIRMNKGGVDYYINRGNVKAMQKDNKGALIDFDKAIAIAPEANAYLNRGNLKYNTKDYAGAAADFTRTLGLDHESQVALLAFMARGNAFVWLGKYNQAISDFSEAIRIDPNYADAYYYRGSVKINKLNDPTGNQDLEAYKKLAGKK